MGILNSNVLIETIEIILTDKKTSAVSATSNSNIETILFLYYFDRVLNALGENARNFLISEFDEIIDGILQDFTKNPLKRRSSELGAYFLGTDYSLKPKVSGKEIFKAKGELMRNNKRLFMQTHFAPLQTNDDTELFVIETVHAFFHHLIGKAKPETRFILGALLDHSFKHYEEIGFNIANVGVSPQLAFIAVLKLEKGKNSAWAHDADELIEG